jgi:hypothetical protein
MTFIFIAGLFALLIGLSYLATTGAVWLVLWCLEELFNVATDFNVWVFGLLVWLLLAMLKGIFSVTIHK